MANNYGKQIEELTKRLEAIEELQEKTRREYNDLLYNLEEENFTPEFLKRILNETEITVTEE